MIYTSRKTVDLPACVLSAHTEPGDIIVDGNSEWLSNTIRRANILATILSYLLICAL